MTAKRKLILFSILAGIVLAAILVNYIFSEAVSKHGNIVKHVYVRDILVKAESVKTTEKIELGLGGRDNLPEGRGMLFEMPEDDVQRFWMKGMRFAIDIIWIENNRVTGCEKNVSPADQRIFTSPGDARFILEVPEGFCDRHKIKINDAVRI